MAWYSLYRWIKTFRKKPYPNINKMYRKYLYDCWFNSLSETEQANELRRVEEDKRREEIESRYFWNHVGYVFSEMARFGRPYMDIGRSLFHGSSKFW